MKTQFGRIGLMIMVAVVILGGFYTYRQGWLSSQEDHSVVTEYPAVDGVDEMIVDTEMPVPGLEGVEEMIVGSEMPVPGLEGVEEMIVVEK